MDPRHEAAAICRREIAVNLAEELALVEERDSLIQSIAISSYYDPMMNWMMERLGVIERDLERARKARRMFQERLFYVVEQALLAGDHTLVQTYWENCPQSPATI